ncbi:MAG: hypothetical protein HYR48_00220 [Gemmatimonadetes bacterium]|nr:hypothetical protein [Gemmatimonadota bacterium]
MSVANPSYSSPAPTFPGAQDHPGQASTTVAVLPRAPEVELELHGEPRGEWAPDVMRHLCSETARVVWAKQGGAPGTLSVALVHGAAPTAGLPHRVAVGAYSPETRTVLLFLEAIERARRDQPSARRLLRALVHEITHDVQHHRNPDLRPSRRGSVTMDRSTYAADPIEREAAREEAAFDAAVFEDAADREPSADVAAYRTVITTRLRILLTALDFCAERAAA